MHETKRYKTENGFILIGDKGPRLARSVGHLILSRASHARLHIGGTWPSPLLLFYWVQPARSRCGRSRKEAVARCPFTIKTTRLANPSSNNVLPDSGTVPPPTMITPPTVVIAPSKAKYALPPGAIPFVKL